MMDGNDPELIAGFARTVIDPHYWPTALKTLCAVCGASKAFITRRTAIGAHIVVPHHQGGDWYSPMVFGFTASEIESYFSDFSEVDPWAEIETRYHPIRPYSMQDYFPVQSLRKSQFWAWLAPQGIVDCVVVELGHDKNGWDALTLFLNAKQAREYRQVLKTLTANLSDLTAMWAAGRQVMQAKDDTILTAAFVARTEEPSLSIDVDNRVLAMNSAAQVLVDQHVIKASVGGQLRVPREWGRNIRSLAPHVAVLDGVAQASDWVPVIAQGRLEATADGQPVQHRFMLLMENLRDPGDRPDWDHPALNAREKRLVRHLADGGQVKDGALLFNISIRANAEVWKAASRKLGGLKKQDLVVRNRDRAKDEER